MPRKTHAATLSALWLVLLSMAAQLVLCRFAAAQGTQAATNNQPTLMDRAKEIAMALSSCPPLVADKAAVYVLEKSGYVRVRESSNGFTALVQHSTPQTREPQCMDAEGMRTFLPRMLKVAELRAQGKNPEEIKRFVDEAFAKGIFQPPTRVGIDYMLSTETVGLNEKGQLVSIAPHVMFYGPYLTNTDLGSDGNPAGPAFVAGEGTPHALIIVPIGRHSDHISDKGTGAQ